MKEQGFSLKPFPPAASLPDVTITGTIIRHANRLAIGFKIHGGHSEIVIPAPADMPVRKDSLWEDTCFEVFLGPKDSDQYWEFNLSPAGHWNVYRFNAYRQGMREEPAFRSLPMSVLNQGDAFCLSLEIDLERIIPTEQPLTVGISAVIKPLHGEGTCWALSHPGPQADFHLRDSFIIEV